MRSASEGGMRGAVSQGFSLVELLFALVVFQVGVLGAAGMILMAQRNLMRAEITVRGVLEARIAADSAREAGAESSGSAMHPWGEVWWAPAPGVSGGVRAAVFAHHMGDTVAVVTVWPRPGASADWPVAAVSAMEADAAGTEGVGTAGTEGPAATAAPEATSAHKGGTP
jgi:hypothetical protein